MPAFQQEKTINARLRSGPIEISASDWLMLNRHGSPETLFAYI